MLWNTGNLTKNDNTGDLKNTAKEQWAEKIRCELSFLSWLLHFWKRGITVGMVRPNIPFLSTSLLLTFQNLSYVIYSQGREGKGEDGSLIVSVKLLSDSRQRREGRISKFEKKYQLSCKCTDKYKFRNDHSRRCFYICGEVKLRLSLIALCNPDSSPASFICLFKGT